MKRKLIFASGLILIAIAFTACEKTCKVCATNTYESGTLVIPGAESEYCGPDLLAKEATPDINVGVQSIRVECR
jgi:hypothetical protein